MQKMFFLFLHYLLILAFIFTAHSALPLTSCFMYSVFHRLQMELETYQAEDPDVRRHFYLVNHTGVL